MRSVVIGCADYWARQLTVAGTEKALALVPENASYHYQLAVLASDADPEKASTALGRSAELDPFEARALIDLGLRAEAQGRLSEAERYLLQAAGVNKQFLPRWSLMNYYFRRNDTARFWFWAKAASAMLYGDPSPMFRLCGMVSEDGALLDRLEIRKANTQAAYVSYLLAINRVDLVGRSALRLVDHASMDDIPLVLESCDRLIDANLAESAVAIWDRLGNSLKTRARFADPAATDVLLDDAFSTPPTSHGFDWRVPQLEGVSASLEESPPGLRIQFSGRQPEICEPLYRYLPVQESTAYTLTVRFNTEGIPPNTGLRWRVADAKGGASLAESPSLASKEGSQADLRFAAPPECKMVRLILAYARASGTTRIEGSIVLREVSVKRSAF